MNLWAGQIHTDFYFQTIKLHIYGFLNSELETLILYGHVWYKKQSQH